jgi:hypothetical protein
MVCIGPQDNYTSDAYDDGPKTMLTLFLSIPGAIIIDSHSGEKFQEQTLL